MSTAARLDRDQVIITAAATGRPHAKIAELAGCSTRTVRRRLADPTVSAAVDAERAQITTELRDALVASGRAVINRLLHIAAGGSDRDAVAAGRVLLAESRMWHEAHYTDERLAEVEELLRQQRGTDDRVAGW